jgi:hypothetical protein
MALREQPCEIRSKRYSGPIKQKSIQSLQSNCPAKSKVQFNGFYRQCPRRGAGNLPKEFHAGGATGRSLFIVESEDCFEDDFRTA